MFSQGLPTIAASIDMGALDHVLSAPGYGGHRMVRSYRVTPSKNDNPEYRKQPAGRQFGLFLPAVDEQPAKPKRASRSKKPAASATA